MNDVGRPEAFTEENVDVSATLTALRRGWWLIALSALAGLIVAIVILHASTYRYTSTMLVSPAQSSSSEGLSSRLGSLGGLASAVGVSLPEGGGASVYRLYIEGLKSYDTAALLARDPQLMHKVFEREWDPVARRWREPRGAVHDLAVAVKGILGIPVTPWHAPDVLRLQTLLQDELMVDFNPRNPVAVVKFEHEDPAFANRFLAQLDTTVDGMLRGRALLRTTDYIAYLNGKLRTVELAEQRVAITQTLGEQERFKMAESSTRPFAAEVFSGPSVSPKPTSPKPLKILSVAMLLGAAVGALVVIRSAQRRVRRLPGG